MGQLEIESIEKSGEEEQIKLLRLQFYYLLLWNDNKIFPIKKKSLQSVSQIEYGDTSGVTIWTAKDVAAAAASARELYKNVLSSIRIYIYTCNIIIFKKVSSSSETVTTNQPAGILVFYCCFFL